MQVQPGAETLRHAMLTASINWCVWFEDQPGKPYFAIAIGRFIHNIYPSFVWRQTRYHWPQRHRGQTSGVACVGVATGVPFSVYSHRAINWNSIPEFDDDSAHESGVNEPLHNFGSIPASHAIFTLE